MDESVKAFAESVGEESEGAPLLSPDARIQALEAMVARLADALRELHDEQNGPPLVQDAPRWEAAMQKAIEILRESEGDG